MGQRSNRYVYARDLVVTALLVAEQEPSSEMSGVIVAGNTPVDRRYPENKNNPVIDKTSSWDPVAAYAPVIKAAKAGGSLFIFQLTHAGRQTPNSVCEEPVSSSDVQTPPMGGKVNCLLQA